MTTLTKDAIKKSFMKLLNQKPINKITVKEIVEDCGINRNSFYYHFDDIPSLMEEIFNDQVDEFVGRDIKSENIYDNLMDAIRFSLENRTAMLHIFNSPNRQLFDHYINRVANRTVTRFFYKMTDEAEKIFAALQRMLPNVPDKDGWVGMAFKKCQELLSPGETNDRLQEDGAEHLQTGIWGEGLAAAYLREKGYVILERDWHSKHRDIDIIAQHGDIIVFVEVKSVWNNQQGNPAARVNVAKQKKIWKTACHFLHTKSEFAPKGFDQPCRFDVLSARVYQKPLQFSHIKNAFEGTQVVPQC